MINIMITNSFNNFIENYYKNLNIEYPNLDSNIFILKLSENNIKNNIKIKLKSNIKKNDWIGFINDNNIKLFYIKDICNNIIKINSNIFYLFDWNLWKLLVGYKPSYSPIGLTKSKNPFPFINN